MFCACESVYMHQILNENIETASTQHWVEQMIPFHNDYNGDTNATDAWSLLQ